MTLFWIGRGLSGIFIFFMLGASIAPKLLGMRVASDTMIELGWNPRHVILIGVIELTCTLLYALPVTSLLGAVLSTALLGGAIATQLRADQPLFSHILFGVYLGLVMWGGLWMRDPKLRMIFPFRAG